MLGRGPLVSGARDVVGRVLRGAGGIPTLEYSHDASAVGGVRAE